MIIPIRCFTCGKVIAHMYEKYLALANDEQRQEFLKNERYCCKRMFITQCDLIDDILRHENEN